MTYPGETPEDYHGDFFVDLPPSPTDGIYNVGFEDGANFVTRAIGEISRLRRQNQSLRHELETCHTERTTLHKLVYEDELTGKPNRRALLKQLETQIAEQPGRIGVIFVDIDGLKQVNDKDGHAAGDELIKSGMEVLDSNLRTVPTFETDLTDQRDVPHALDVTGKGGFRLSGDEGVGVVTNISDESELEIIVRRLRGAYDQRGVRASIGYVLHQDGQSATKVVSEADQAMYVVKQERHALEQARERDALPAHILSEGAELAARAEELGIGVDGLKRYFGNPGR